MIVGATNAFGAPLHRNPDGSLSSIEGGEVRLHVRSATPASVRVGGVSATLVGAAPGEDGTLRYEFAFAPRTWAGRAEIVAEAGEARWVATLDVAPHPGKLGATSLLELLQELSAVDPGLAFGLAPGRHAASDAATGTRHLLVHPFVIRAVLPALLNLIAQIARDPLRRPVRETEPQRLARVRTVDSGLARWLAHRGEWRDGDGGIALGMVVPARVVRMTVAHPANEYLVFLIRRVAHALRRTARWLDEIARGERMGRVDPSVREVAADLLPVVRRGAAQCDQVTRRRPFNAITPREPGAGAVQAMVDDPRYLRAQLLARRLLQPRLAAAERGDADATLRPTFDLFELVVLYRLYDALRDACPGFEWKHRVLLDRSGLLEPARRTFARGRRKSDGASVTLHFQETFASVRNGGDPRHGFRSITSERRPDYLVVVRRRDTPPHWIILDAKYRVSRAGLDDGLADVHVYRDALRLDGRPASGAYVIAPPAAHDMRAFGAAGYLDKHRFGLWSAEPEVLAARLCEALARWV